MFLKIFFLIAIFLFPGCANIFSRGSTITIENGVSILSTYITSSVEIINEPATPEKEYFHGKPIVVDYIKDDNQSKYKFLYNRYPVPGCPAEPKLLATIHFDDTVDIEYTTYNWILPEPSGTCKKYTKTTYYYHSKKGNPECKTSVEYNPDTGTVVLNMSNCRLDLQTPVAKNYINMENLMLIVQTGQDVIWYEGFDILYTFPDYWLGHTSNKGFGVGRVYDEGFLVTNGHSSSDIDVGNQMFYGGPGSPTWSNYEFSGRIVMTKFRYNEVMGNTFYYNYTSTVHPQLNQYYLLKYRGDEKDFFLETSPDMSHSLTCDKGNRAHVEASSCDYLDYIYGRCNTWTNYKIKVMNLDNSTHILIKVWVSGEGEPADWQIDCHDESEDRLRSGTVGAMFHDSNYGNTYVCAWDDMRVVKIPDESN